MYPLVVIKEGGHFSVEGITLIVNLNTLFYRPKLDTIYVEYANPIIDGDFRQENYFTIGWGDTSHPKQERIPLTGRNVVGNLYLGITDYVYVNIDW